MDSIVTPSSLFLGQKGDVILRSSDGHDLHVIKAILTIASPFFSSLFSLPQPQDQNDVQTISVPEDSKTLDVLLRFCYPVRNPVVKDLDLATSVLAASLKYEMEVGIQAMARVLVSEETLATQAVRVYVICCRYKLAEEARIAAIASLRGPIDDVYCDEFDVLPASWYFRLLRFHREVKSAVIRALQGSQPSSSLDALLTRVDRPSCRKIYYYDGCNSKWWDALVSERLIPGISRGPLDSSLFSQELLNFAISKNSCSTCTDTISAQYVTAIESLRGVINKAASEGATLLLTF